MINKSWALWKLSAEKKVQDSFLEANSNSIVALMFPSACTENSGYFFHEG